MKKLLLYAALLMLTLSACKKSNLPEVRPDDRINAQLAAYQSQLSGSTYGWIGYMFPAGGGSYTFTFQFTNTNRVTTLADINATSASTPLESSYRLKAAMLPSLYFDTYTYLHILADPDPAKSGGSQGVGLVSDFEFSFISATTDTIRLKGNVNNSDLILVRKKQTDGDDFIAKATAFNTSLNQMSNFNYYYNLLSIGGKTYDIAINTQLKTVSFYYPVNGTFKSFSTYYSVSTTGLSLLHPFVDGTTNISEMHNFTFDIPQGKMSFTAGTVAGATTNVATPLTISLTAARKMFTDGGGYGSYTGFTVGGVIDYFKLTTIPGFSVIAYYPNYYNNPADVIFIYYGSRSYGPAFNTTLPANGAIVFANPGGFGFQGTSPGAPYTTYVTNFRTQLFNTSGYYVFPTSDFSYDLVSVADSRIWIRF
ncbi:DUF4302 domain-containing protein [Mucilaginibacter paludis]|uniref:DUF4302 domain-containing protein n=1 Tax=Mucilaginibacter paludis DSM 18603 TaxID=714943 RepID=H1YCY7_9SPHI|nr:DUF4302 domain-containing protein [Mucilaginibacter paludis]EHQ25158.1 hypothetical protein Mucpa_0984 [Mucilaginibacter paludis DSM 18603]